MAQLEEVFDILVAATDELRWCHEGSLGQRHSDVENPAFQETNEDDPLALFQHSMVDYRRIVCDYCYKQKHLHPCSCFHVDGPFRHPSSPWIHAHVDIALI